MQIGPANDASLYTHIGRTDGDNSPLPLAPMCTCSSTESDDIRRIMTDSAKQ